MRILIADDEPLIVETLQRLLESMASRIDAAYDLDTALALSAANEYHVIVLDLRFPNTGKKEALAAIRVFKARHAAVVVVSGLPEPGLKDEVMAAGADAFVPKDGDFGAQAMLLATQIATLKLPRDSYLSHSYLAHVDLLDKMAKNPAAESASSHTTDK